MSAARRALCRPRRGLDFSVVWFSPAGVTLFCVKLCVTQSFLSFLTGGPGHASAATAAAWELGGHSIAAPALAGLLVAVDAYVLRAGDAAERTVAVVRFDEVKF